MRFEATVTRRLLLQGRSAIGPDCALAGSQFLPLPWGARPRRDGETPG